MTINVGVFILQFLVLMTVVCGVLIFALKKTLFDSTQGAVNRLNRETEEVRKKQAELNEKIKLANEELEKRRAEADALVAKMKTDAEQKALEEREKIIQKARADGEEIISKAQRTKDDMRKALEKEIDLKAVDFSVFVLSEIFSEKIKNDFDQRLISDFLENLEKVDMTMISEDIKTAEVATVNPLDDKIRGRLNEILRKKLNRDIILNESIDATLINGLVLRFGSLALNGSMQYILKEKGMEIKEKLEKGILKQKK